MRRVGTRHGLGGVTFALALSAVLAGAAPAQEIPRDEYLAHLPLSTPRLGAATDASRELHLFGDPSAPGYRDVAPTDGIDDLRAANLQALAVRFAPFLVQNTGDLPVDFEVYLRSQERFPLFVDRWNLAGMEAELEESRGVNLAAMGGAACAGDPTDAWDRYPEPTNDPAVEDCKFLHLMERYTPGAGRTIVADETLVRQDPNHFDVLFLNFPGEGADNWKEAYQPVYESLPESERNAFPHSFVHPFLRRVADGGYELLLQYWLFYPNNDSGMDHEGDWEHVNSVISPRSMVGRGLDRATLERILDGDWPTGDGAPDPLVLKRIDYYFHEFSMTMDFASPNVYLPREEWEAEVDRMVRDRLGQKGMWEEIRYRAYLDDDETVVNTHPWGYIGSDNKGLNQALEPPGGSNRDAHGTYPYAGRYTNVGPGGTTDQVTRFRDHRRYFRDRAAGRADMGPDFRAGGVLGLADPERLRLIPDWERIVEQAWEDPGVRRTWGWMLLPIRWGYPATRSPFSGILENFNTGNVAPPGPMHNAGWNVSGPSSGFHAYDPHSLPAVFPLEIQDNFRNDLGFLNLTVPTLLNLPPLDFVSRIVAYPFERLLTRRNPVFYPNETVPFRFVGISSGISRQSLDEEFDGLALNPGQLEEFVGSFVNHLTGAGLNEETRVLSSNEFMEAAVGTFIQVPFFLGGKFSSENMVRNTRSEFGAEVDFNNIAPYTYSAAINHWEYAGSLRYNVLTGAVQPYVKGGYGWAWYRLEDVQSSGVPFAQPNSKWFGPSNILPNVWHYGLGVEFIPLRRVGDLPGGVDLGIKVEFVRYDEGLELDFSDIPLDDLQLLFPTLGDVPSAKRVQRNDLLIGLVLSF